MSYICHYCDKKEAIYACGACHDAFYCSKECQQMDWNEDGHLPFCEGMNENDVWICEDLDDVSSVDLDEYMVEYLFDTDTDTESDEENIGSRKKKKKKKKRKKRKRRSKRMSSSKAKKILRHGTIRGKKLTPRQRRWLGWVAGGRK